MVEPNPFQTILETAGGYVLPRCLHVVADLGVADALDDTPRTAAELAAAVGAHPDALGRILHLLAAHGIFAIEGDTFRHTPPSRLLRSDHPQSMRAFVRMFGAESWWRMYGALAQTARTGMPAAHTVFPAGYWTYLAQHPEEGAVFNAAMTALSHGMVAGVLAAYDFSGFGRVGDIGGGRGHLLRAVLDAVPMATGVLFDVPQVIAEAEEMASARLTLQTGDFFQDALPVCDAYLLKEVIHDWDDERAVAILQAIRRAAPDHAKLLVIEVMMPDDPGPHFAKVADVHMMTLFGGRQRTRQEYAALLCRAGFSLPRQIDTAADYAILEALPA